MIWYQPFLQKNVEHSCLDCPQRYDAIRADFGEVTGKRLVDFFSANCYFGFRFLADGGASVRAVESDPEVIEDVDRVATTHGLDLICASGLKHVVGYFHIGLMLDSFGYGGTDEYLPLLKSCGCAYVSAPHKPTERFLCRLNSEFPAITPVYTGIDGKVIYRCQS